MTWGRLVVGGVALVVCAATGCGPSYTRAGYEAAAGSAAARTNRTLYDRWATAPLARLQQELPAAQWSEPRLREVCEADYATGFSERDAGTLTCETNYVRQAGFDGELPDVLRAVDAAARKLGWPAGGSPPEAALAYYEINHRGGASVDATSVPTVSYLVPEPAAGTTGCDGPSYLRESAVERSSSPAAKDFTERPVPDAIFERSSGPPAATTAPGLLRGHRLVLTFGMSGRCRLPAG